jgi:hypothetical protein
MPPWKHVESTAPWPIAPDSAGWIPSLAHKWSAGDRATTPASSSPIETVNVILEASARILELEGLRGFNTNTVAAKAGVSVGSLYQYFPNKDAILVALINSLKTRLKRVSWKPYGLGEGGR